MCKAYRKMRLFFVSLRGVRGAEMAISGRAGRGTPQTIFFQNLSQKLCPNLQPISKSKTKNSNIKN